MKLESHPLHGSGADTPEAATPPLVVAASRDSGLLKLVQLTLHGDGMAVRTAASHADARRQIEDFQPQLVVVVDDLRDAPIVSVVEDLSCVPGIRVIALISARRGMRISAVLDAGAADCLELPFHPDELAARARAVLRRIPPDGAGTIVFAGNLRIDLHDRTVRRDGERIRLTRTEWDVLESIAAGLGEPVAVDEIELRVWGNQWEGDPRRVSHWVSRVRTRLGTAPNTRWPIRRVGSGYALDLDPPEGSSDPPG